MPDDEYGKRRKKDPDCGCGHDDEEWAANAVKAFAEAIQMDDLSPDPRGTTVRRWSGLIAPYGLPTGDGRRFSVGALSARDLPLPVKWQRVDDNGHKSAVTVGRIDGINYSDEGVDAWGIIFDPDPSKPSLDRLRADADEAYELLRQKVVGPSVDIDDMDFHPLPAAPGELSSDGRQEIEVTKGRISAITLVQIPAFSQARPFALDDLDAEEYAEMTAVTAAAVAEGMDQLPVADVEWNPVDWLVDALETDSAGALYVKGDVALFPVATIVAGALALVPGAVADAVSVLAYHDEDIDLPDGEKQALRLQLEALTAACGLPNPPWAQAALVASAAGGATALPPAELFERPKFDGPTPVRIERVGDHLHYSGHVATWGVCHIGFPGQCVTAPKSRSGYAYFHNGPTRTDKGEVRTGKITLGGGHADVRMGFQAAVAHYDDAGAAVADVRAGEDEYGIWVSGVVRPNVDAQRLAELAAAPLSGDWRHVGGSLEMVAALAVNTPGFPVIEVSKRGGREVSLVAAGALHSPAPAGAAPDLHATVRAEIAKDRRVRATAGAFSAMLDEHRQETRTRARAVAQVFG